MHGRAVVIGWPGYLGRKIIRPVVDFGKVVAYKVMLY